MSSFTIQQVTKEQFETMKNSEKLKARMEGLEYHMLPEDEK